MSSGSPKQTTTGTNSKSLYLSLLLLACLIGVACSMSTWEAEDNSTIFSSSSSQPEVHAAPYSPWPGSKWLDNINTSPSATPYTEPSTGFKSPSTYSALLSDAPHEHPIKNFNEYVNSFMFSDYVASFFVNIFGLYWAHYLITYFRNLLSGMVVYYGTASVFHYHCYIHPRNVAIFSDRVRPSSETIWNQIRLSQSSLFFYSALPVFSDFLIEEGYTLSYYTLEDIGGWLPYFVYQTIYFILVEICIYWMHRTLHENRFLYNHVHRKHHQYNKPETLTPWASIAFHPLDGILQASPYVFWLLFVPCQYLTHVGLVFATAVWATYIHDAMDWNVDPIMGSKYHTVHHTHFIYNYGQIFTFCDWYWGTLRVPMKKTGIIGERQVLEGGGKKEKKRR